MRDLVYIVLFGKSVTTGSGCMIAVESCLVITVTFLTDIPEEIIKHLYSFWSVAVDQNTTANKHLKFELGWKNLQVL